MNTNQAADFRPGRPVPGDVWRRGNETLTIDRVTKCFVFAHRNDHAPESLQTVALREYPAMARRTLASGATFHPVEGK